MQHRLQNAPTGEGQPVRRDREPGDSAATVTDLDAARRARRQGLALPAPAQQREAAVRIFRPARSVMQAGARRQPWVLEFEAGAPTWLDPLTGWTASADPLSSVRLTFASRQQAIRFAERQGWRWTAEPEHDDA